MSLEAITKDRSRMNKHENFGERFRWRIRYIRFGNNITYHKFKNCESLKKKKNAKNRPKQNKKTPTKNKTRVFENTIFILSCLFISNSTCPLLGPCQFTNIANTPEYLASRTALLKIEHQKSCCFSWLWEQIVVWWLQASWPAETHPCLGHL